MVGKSHWQSIHISFEDCPGRKTLLNLPEALPKDSTFDPGAALNFAEKAFELIESCSLFAFPLSLMYYSIPDSSCQRSSLQRI